MVKSTVQKNNFTTGQISPRMSGRDDLEFYNASVEKQVNFVSEVEGPASYRLGSTFLGESHQNNLAYLYDFVFAEDESYALEFTNLALRFWSANAQGDYELVEDTSSPGNPLVITTPYTEAQIPFLHFAQTADTMYITHPDVRPQVLTRTGANEFTIADHAATGLDFGQADNIPSTVTIFQSRLVYAGLKGHPQQVRMSRSFSYDDFTIGTNDADPLSYTIGSDRANPIRSLSSITDTLNIGTLGGLFDGSATGSDKNITPTNLRISSTGSKGVSQLRMLKRDNVVLYLQVGSRTINSYGYSEDVNSNTSIDRTIFSEDITVSGVSNIHFVNGIPDNLYCVLNNGKIALLIWKPEQRVFGWNSLETDGKYISVTSLPRPVGNDRILISTQREIEGSTKNYIEIVAEDYELPQREDFFTGDANVDDEAWRNDLVEAQKEYIHLDCSTTYDGVDVGSNASANLTFNAASGTSVRVTSSANLFTASSVGKEIRELGSKGRAEIINFVSATEVDVRIDVDFTVTTLNAGNYYITTDVIDNLSYLEGKVVSICADGAHKASQEVSGGKISLDSQFTKVHVGLPYRGTIITNNLNTGNPAGSAQATRKNATKSYLHLLNTLGCSYGLDMYQLEDILFQSTKNQYGHAPVPFTGFKEAKGFQRTSEMKKINIIKEDPTPCTVLQIITELDTYRNV